MQSKNWVVMLNYNNLWCDKEALNVIKKIEYGWKCRVLDKGSHDEHKCYKHGEKGKVNILSRSI